MSDNNTSTIKMVFWLIFLIVVAILVMCYFPLFKERLQTVTKSTGLVSTKEVEYSNDTNVFSEYEVKDNDIIINSYLDGIVFNSSEDYTVKVLKDDMGYILTSEEQNSTPPKEYYFIGKGWFNMTTSPTIPVPIISDTEITIE